MKHKLKHKSIPGGVHTDLCCVVLCLSTCTGTLYLYPSIYAILPMLSHLPGGMLPASSGKDKKDNLEDFSIPDNHPWAEKKGVSEDDEELIKARLAVKRGLPLETLNDE